MNMYQVCKRTTTKLTGFQLLGGGLLFPLYRDQHLDQRLLLAPL